MGMADYMISVDSSGSFNHIESYLRKLASGKLYTGLDRHGQAGVNALAHATPVDTGLTSQSWQYRIIKASHGPMIEWYNTNDEVAILIQYGHGTGTGGYVVAKDYINPAMKPIFDQIINDFLKEVSR